MEVARAWVRGELAEGQTGQDETMAEAAFLGFDATSLDGLKTQLNRGRATLKIWAVNLPIVTAFLAVSTQWRTALVPTERGFALRHIGLDYAGAKAGLAALGLAVSAEEWAGIQVMELAAVAEFNGGGW